MPASILKGPDADDFGPVNEIPAILYSFFLANATSESMSWARFAASRAVI